jgi:hypothetical protein
VGILVSFRGTLEWNQVAGKAPKTPGNPLSNHPLINPQNPPSSKTCKMLKDKFDFYESDMLFIIYFVFSLLMLHEKNIKTQMHEKQEECIIKWKNNQRQEMKKN